MTGVGLDVIEIDRIERALARRPHIAQRLFTEEELAYANTRARPAQHLAARFCAKEAATKALGMDVMCPQEIEVLGGAAQTRLILHGSVRDRARELGVEAVLSLTHSREMAGAIVLLR